MSLVPDSIERYTSHLRLAIYKFGALRWHDALNAQADAIDLWAAGIDSRVDAAQDELEAARGDFATIGERIGDAEGTTEANAALSVQKAAEAKADADRAKTEADRAETVVTGGNGSTAPAAGKYALAGVQGLHLPGWTWPVESQAQREARAAAGRDEQAASGVVGPLPPFEAVEPGYVGFTAPLRVRGLEIRSRKPWRWRLAAASSDPALESRADLPWCEVSTQVVMEADGTLASGFILIDGRTDWDDAVEAGVPLGVLDAGFSAAGTHDLDHRDHYAYFLADSDPEDARAHLMAVLSTGHTGDSVYRDADGRILQDFVRPRLDVGGGNDWANPRGFGNAPVQHSVAVRPRPQGNLNAPTNNSNLFYGYGSGSFTLFAQGSAQADVGIANARTKIGGFDVLMVGAGLITRGNTGVYSLGTAALPPNPEGHAALRNQADDSPIAWHEYDPANPDHPEINTLADLFDPAKIVGGDAGSGISGHPDGLFHGDFNDDPDGQGDVAHDFRLRADVVSLEQVDREYSVPQGVGSVGVAAPSTVVETSDFTSLGPAASGNFESVAPVGFDYTPATVGAIIYSPTNPNVYAEVYQYVALNRVYARRADGGAWADEAARDADFPPNTPFLMQRSDLHLAGADVPRRKQYIHCDIIGDRASLNWPDWLSGKMAGELATAGVPAFIDANTGALQRPADVPVVNNTKDFRLSRRVPAATYFVAVYAITGSGIAPVPAGAANGQWRYDGSQPAGNEIRFTSSDWSGAGAFDDDTVFLVLYYSAANPLAPADLAPSLRDGQTVKVLVGSTQAQAVHNLIGRFATHPDAGIQQADLAITSRATEADGTPSDDAPIVHAAIPAEFDVDSPAVKLARSLVDRDGLTAVQYKYQTALRDGASYNDDGQITPTDGLTEVGGQGPSGLALPAGTVEILTQYPTGA